MPAYFIVQNTIKDEAQYQKYVQAVVPFIASFGGKLAARRAKVEVLEGEHDERPVVMFEFPDMEASLLTGSCCQGSPSHPARFARANGVIKWASALRLQVAFWHIASLR
jgi:uncharacterized protein (DUF1330 family)